METGRKILNLRKDLGVPQKSLANQTSVTPSALSRIESGHHQPRGPVALRIARELGVTVDYLLDNEAPYPPPPRELLENLRRSDLNESQDLTVQISRREKGILESLRHLDEERIVVLETALAATRGQARFATYLLGGKCPGVDTDELQEFKQQLG